MPPTRAASGSWRHLARTLPTRPTRLLLLVALAVVPVLFYSALHASPPSGAAPSALTPLSFSWLDGWLAPSRPPLARASLVAALTGTTPAHAAAGATYAYTLTDAGPNDVVELGAGRAMPMPFNDSDVLDLSSGYRLTGAVSNSFNPAVLKLPPGAQWQFLVVARGPIVPQKDVKVNGFDAMKSHLVAYGADLDAGGTLVPVSEPHALYMPMQPNSAACAYSGHWVATYGPEDPRLFWTDGWTPALSFEQMAHEANICRTLGVVLDMRDLYRPLIAALDGVAHVPPYAADLGNTGLTSKGLHKTEGNPSLEKNWMPFYPGAAPDPRAAPYPHMHYTLSPAVSMAYARENSHRVFYDVLPATSPADMCFARAHPRGNHWHQHQATPLYRLTLCARGCVADVHNTLFVTVAHILTYETGPRRYEKFVATFNTTAPFDPVSVGPLFRLADVGEATEINYILALAPLEAADRGAAAARRQPAKLPAPYLPNHFFIDDDVMFTFGHRDNEMWTTVVSVADLLARHRMCEGDL